MLTKRKLLYLALLIYTISVLSLIAVFISNIQHGRPVIMIAFIFLLGTAGLCLLLHSRVLS